MKMNLPTARALLVLAGFLFLLAPGVAVAGPIDATLGKWFGLSDVSYWVDAVLAVTGLLSVAMAVLPQGATGGAWDKTRTVLNIVAANWGSAKNIKK